MKPVPDPIVVNTGDQHKDTKTIEDFFSETKKFIQKHYDVFESEFQIKSGEIAYHPSQLTDDRITYLYYGETILASVLETRTEFNNVRYTFFRNEKKIADAEAPAKTKEGL